MRSLGQSTINTKKYSIDMNQRKATALMRFSRH
ncbi:hypothetical protein X962_4838 [Burkholderia pseudomallei MSHR7343]|nr:hypothetical protein BPC006_I1398 [Burkholderia pseudomallei BPC006]KGS24727.1 hypothetical protein X962_4838 [Burkholderia pseudomallei MSHR7343]